MRFTIFPLHLSAPATKKWCQVIRSAAPVTQNHLPKTEDLMLQNATPLRKSAPGPYDVEKVHAVVARSTFRSQKCKNWRVQCTFGSWDVEKVHAVVARSTFRGQNVLKTLHVRTIFGCSHHSGVQFFISHLTTLLCTRHLSQPTFRPSGATNHWKNTMFRDFPTFSRAWIFFLPRSFWSSFFFLLSSSLLFSSLLFSDSSHLCFSSVNVVGSLVSKLPSINTTQPFSRITGGIGDVCSGSSGQELLFVDFQRCLFDLGQDMPRRSWHHVSSFKEHESCRWLPAFLNCARYRISVTAPGAKPQCFLRGPRPPPFDLSQPCTKRSVHRCPEEFVGMVIFQRRWQWSIYGWWFTIKTRRLSIAMRNHRRVCLYIYIYNYKYMYTYLHQFAMY